MRKKKEERGKDPRAPRDSERAFFCMMMLFHLSYHLGFFSSFQVFNGVLVYMIERKSNHVSTNSRSKTAFVAHCHIASHDMAFSTVGRNECSGPIRGGWDKMVE